MSISKYLITSLVGTQYTTLREAIEMIAANDKAEIKILVNIPNEANTIDQNKDITIDLNAKTIDCLTCHIKLN